MHSIEKIKHLFNIHRVICMLEYLNHFFNVSTKPSYLIYMSKSYQNATSFFKADIYLRNAINWNGKQLANKNSFYEIEFVIGDMKD